MPPGPKELAARLREIRADPKLYANFFAWKKNAQIRARMQALDRSFGPKARGHICDMCERYVEKFGCHMLDPPPAGCPQMARGDAKRAWQD